MSYLDSFKHLPSISRTMRAYYSDSISGPARNMISPSPCYQNLPECNEFLRNVGALNDCADYAELILLCKMQLWRNHVPINTNRKALARLLDLT